MIPITQTEKMRLENDFIKTQVQKVLQWDDLQYGSFQAAMGEAYLKEEFEITPEIAQELMKSKVYWSWWINHWTQRDIVWLQHNPRPRGFVTVAAYKLHHNPAAIVFKPHNTILRESYKEMIGNLIDSVHYGG